jgi:hypothetical protein
VCPVDSPMPASHASELEGRAPDMRFLSRDTAGRAFIDDHVRLNGAVLMDERVANIMLAGYSGWINRSFQPLPDRALSNRAVGSRRLSGHQRVPASLSDKGWDAQPLPVIRCITLSLRTGR